MLPSHYPTQEWAALDNARYYAAARLATRGWSVGGPLRRVMFASAHPHLIPNYVQLLRRLPVVLLQLTGLPAGNLLYDRWRTTVVAPGSVTRRVDDADISPGIHARA